MRMQSSGTAIAINERMYPSQAMMGCDEPDQGILACQTPSVFSAPCLHELGNGRRISRNVFAYDYCTVSPNAWLKVRDEKAFAYIERKLRQAEKGPLETVKLPIDASRCQNSR